MLDRSPTEAQHGIPCGWLLGGRPPLVIKSDSTNPSDLPVRQNKAAVRAGEGGSTATEEISQFVRVIKLEFNTCVG
tara:strand:+ start:277 stop:504 length:228 start_codon:yes stop_codon:yes gene_type:complete